MDDDYADYSGRLLADRYRLPRPPAEEYELAESRAYDTASGQEVLVRQVPLPEVVDAEFMEDGPGRGGAAVGGSYGRATRRPADPGVRRALEAAVAASRVPDHPRLDQVFDVFVEGDGLWIVSELVPGRPLAALMAERPLSPHRAAEIAADLLAALHTVHAHGWVHRNITARSVLICEDGRALLTGLAVGAAEEALCGYDPLPESAAPPQPGIAEADGPAAPGLPGAGAGIPAGVPRGATPALPPGYARDTGPRDLPGGTGRAGPEFGHGGYHPDYPDDGISDSGYAQTGPTGQTRRPGHPDQPPPSGPSYGGGARHHPGDDAQRAGIFGFEGEDSGGGAAARAARRGAIAAYRAGARAASARVEAEQQDRAAAERSAEVPTEVSPEVGDWWSLDQRAPEGGPSEASGPGAALPGEYGPQGQPYGPVESGSRADSAGSGAEPERWTGEGPTALPGPRRGSVSVPAPWTSRPPEPRSPELPEQQSYEQQSYSPEPYTPQSYAPEPYAAEGALPDADLADLPDVAGPENERVLDIWAPDALDTPEPGIPDFTAPAPPAPEPHEAPDTSGWDEAPEDTGGRYRGPLTALDAERARQARMMVVGAVTERWAPEQAGPVYENWRLAPPVGPAADLWALGVLLFRSVQGHSPYPEDSPAELVQMVCAEPPAFAEECGALRPVVESLMRQDPMERPDFEELRGWLRSLIRSAPEPEVGRRPLAAPPLLEPGGPADPRRLPIKRRRGELVRRRRSGKQAVSTGRRTAQPRAERVRERRVDREREYEREPEVSGGVRAEAPEPREPRERRSRAPRPPREPRQRRERPEGSPRKLGRLLVGVVLLVLTLVVLIALVFMPGDDDSSTDGSQNQRGSVGEPAAGDEEQDGSDAKPDGGAKEAEKDSDKDAQKDGAKDDAKDDGAKGGDEKQPAPPADAAEGFTVHQDPTGFQIAVPEGWNRRAPNSRGQVRFDEGEFEMVVVKGRDSTDKYGKDPLDYQADSESELAPFRSSGWSSATSLRRIDVGETAMAEGTYTWEDASGRKVYVRNRAMILDGRYHLVLVIGPEDEKAAVDGFFDGAADTYRALKG